MVITVMNNAKRKFISYDKWKRSLKDSYTWYKKVIASNGEDLS